MTIFIDNSNIMKIIRDENGKIVKTAERILCECMDNDGKFFTVKILYK